MSWMGGKGGKFLSPSFLSYCAHLGCLTKGRSFGGGGGEWDPDEVQTNILPPFSSPRYVYILNGLSLLAAKEEEKEEGIARTNAFSTQRPSLARA